MRETSEDLLHSSWAVQISEVDSAVSGGGNRSTGFTRLPKYSGLLPLLPSPRSESSPWRSTSPGSKKRTTKNPITAKKKNEYCNFSLSLRRQIRSNVTKRNTCRARWSEAIKQRKEVQQFAPPERLSPIPRPIQLFTFQQTIFDRT
jgi:hypothetical protein